MASFTSAMIFVGGFSIRRLDHITAFDGWSSLHLGQAN